MEGTTLAPAESGAEAREGYPLVAATGMLGSGFREESIVEALELGAMAIGCDAGSTDAGPHALATGEPQFSRSALKRDLGVLIRHGVRAGVPVIIGSAATGGGAKNLALLAEIAREVAADDSLHFKLALIDSEQSKDTLRSLNRQGRIRPLPPEQELTDDAIDEALHVVAMMGVEPIQEAWKSGAQVIIAGRASDTAIYASLPLLHGCDPGVAWHAAKILECGAAAVTQRAAPDSMFAVLNGSSFDIWPLREDYRCTPQSIASHSFYENVDPFLLYEPAGVLDLRQARYEAIDHRSVRVSGASFERSEEYTVKLEGARLAGYSTIVAGGIRDPLILARLDEWLKGLDETLAIRIAAIFGDDIDYKIKTRVYGRDGVMGQLEPTPTFEGHEAFLLWDVLSGSQELSHSIASSLSHMAAHYPIPEWSGLITGVAFPFAPSEVNRGPVYEFFLNHLASLESPLELFTTTYEEV